MADFITEGCFATWGVLLALAAFGLGCVLNRKIAKAWCNPLLLGNIFVIVLLSVTNIPYQTFYASAAPLQYLLFPATICLAVPLYEKWQLLRRDSAAIFAGLLAGVLTSLGSVLLMALVLHLEAAQYISLLPKSVTTSIGMDVAAELGGMASLTGAVIVLTGMVGNLLAQPMCRILRLTSPVARGIAIGSASHAIGTAKALEMGETEGAMSGLAVAVAGILTALLSPVFAGFIK